MALTLKKFLIPVVVLAVFVLLSGLVFHFIEKEEFGAPGRAATCIAGESYLHGVDLASSVVTAIGYGHILPCTPAGKVVTCIVAIIGLPLTLFVLDQVGKVLVFLARKSVSLVNRPCQRKDVSKTKDNITIDSALPLWIGLLVAFVWIFISAAFFAILEDWALLQALYFVFISVTTVGLSPYDPRMIKNTIYNYYFLFIGLAAVSMCINLVKDKITEKFTRARSEIEQQQSQIAAGLGAGITADEVFNLALKKQGAYQYLFSESQRQIIEKDAAKAAGLRSMNIQTDPIVLSGSVPVIRRPEVRNVSQQVTKASWEENELIGPREEKMSTVVISKHDDGTVVSEERPTVRVPQNDPQASRDGAMRHGSPKKGRSRDRR